MQTVLVTGAAGRAGTALRPFLRGRFRLRLADRLPLAAPQPGEEVVTGWPHGAAETAPASPRRRRLGGT